jgi:glycerol-3-phosphate dehydrogenase
MERFIENYQGETFDVAIIGGGITGAAVAYAASSRGLKVALFEKKDFGGATSAATSKLIHGGPPVSCQYGTGTGQGVFKRKENTWQHSPELYIPYTFYDSQLQALQGWNVDDDAGDVPLRCTFVR